MLFCRYNVIKSKINKLSLDIRLKTLKILNLLRDFKQACVNVSPASKGKYKNN